MIAVSLRHVPESRDPSATGPIDVMGSALVTVGLIGLTYGLIEGPSAGWGTPGPLAALIAGVIVLVAFVLWERRAAEPIMPLDMFASAQFSTANVATFVVYAALGGAFFLLPIQLEVVSGYSALEAGIALLPVTVIMLLLSARSGALAQRIGPRLQMTVGPLVIAAGLALFARIGPGGDYLTEVLPAMVVFGFGLCHQRGAADGHGAGRGPGRARWHRLGHQQRRGPRGRPDRRRRAARGGRPVRSRHICTRSSSRPGSGWRRSSRPACVSAAASCARCSSATPPRRAGAGPSGRCCTARWTPRPPPPPWHRPRCPATAARPRSPNMRGAGIDRFGGPVRVLPRPDPRALRDDEVLIRVRAAGMGNWDDITRTGGWATGATPPCALGVEAAGVIIAAGDRVSGLRPGDGVLTHPLPLREDGAWAEQLIAPAALVARKPAGVPWPEAAALPVPGLTALQALTGSVQLAAGETVLVNGAGGVTGGLLVQLAALGGARVIATASPASAPRLRRAGADLVLDYHQPDWPDRARQAAGGPLPAAVNAVPGGAARLLPLIADGGRLTTLTSDPPDPARQVRIDSLYVQPDAGQLGYLAQLLDRGAITLTVRASYRLDSAAEALAQARRGGGGAAVVLEPAG